jgi:hypothetical protein
MVHWWAVRSEITQSGAARTMSDCRGKGSLVGEKLVTNSRDTSRVTSFQRMKALKKLEDIPDQTKRVCIKF